MSDTGRIEALKAAFRGVVRTADSLNAMRVQVEALSENEPPDVALLADVARVGAAVAASAATLRSLSETFMEKASGTR